MDSISSRYQRQIILPEFGLEGQEKLCGSKVLLIGLGGLGSPVSIYLASAGIGHLGLADFDCVEASNLHRQVLFDEESLGKPKIEVARERLKSIQPSISLELHREGLQIDNAVQIMKLYDLIIDGSDNFSTRFLANDAAFFAGKPLLSGSIFQYEGQISMFFPNAGYPCYRCLYPEMPGPGEVPNCAEAGVLGALCGIVGSLMAMEAIKWITGIGEGLGSKLLTIDSRTMKFRNLSIQKDPACPLCGNSPMIETLDPKAYAWSCGTVQSIPLEIDLVTFLEQIKTQDTTILDVREEEEWEFCHLPGSQFLPLSSIATNFHTLEPSKNYITLCHHGMRSLKAAHFLREKGLPNVQSLKGGIDQYSLKVDSSLPRY